jgi:hypothetical protein
MSDSNWLFRACKIVDGWFRQLERLVSLPVVAIGNAENLLFYLLDRRSASSFAIVA